MRGVVVCLIGALGLLIAAIVVKDWWVVATAVVLMAAFGVGLWGLVRIRQQRAGERRG